MTEASTRLEWRGATLLGQLRRRFRGRRFRGFDFRFFRLRKGFAKLPLWAAEPSLGPEDVS